MAAPAFIFLCKITDMLILVYDFQKIGHIGGLLLGIVDNGMPFIFCISAMVKSWL